MDHLSYYILAVCSIFVSLYFAFAQADAYYASLGY